MKKGGPCAAGIILTLFMLAALCACDTPRPEAPRTFTQDGERYVRIRDMASHYGLGKPRAAGIRFHLSDSRNVIRMEQDSRRVDINGVQVWLHDPVQKRRRHWSVAQIDIETLFEPLLRYADHLSAYQVRLIVLDPGHGGRDTGGLSESGLMEKDLVLDISRRVRAHLVNNGFKVRMTRDTDTHLTLAERTEQARNGGADLFVSIHLNTASNPDAQGSETFVLTAEGWNSTQDTGARPTDLRHHGNDHNAANALLGYVVQRRLLETTGNADRGLRRARFAVLRDAPCPAVLVECAFLSHRPEERHLREIAYRERIAKGIAQGVFDYAQMVNRARALEQE